MKKLKSPASQSEAMKLRWKKRIVFEKGYTESCAEWMAERLEALLDHMQYGHATIAYRKQNGSFQLVKASSLLECGRTAMDDIPGGELHGVETDRIGCHHRLHGFSRMNYLYFEESSENVFGNPE